MNRSDFLASSRGELFARVFDLTRRDDASGMMTTRQLQHLALRRRSSNSEQMWQSFRGRRQGCAVQLLTGFNTRPVSATGNRYVGTSAQLCECHVRHPEALDNFHHRRRPHELVECIASKTMPMSDGRFLRRAGRIGRLRPKKAFRGNSFGLPAVRRCGAPWANTGISIPAPSTATSISSMPRPPASVCMPCAQRRQPMRRQTRPTLPRCRNGLGTLMYPRHASTTAAKLVPRTARVFM